MYRQTLLVFIAVVGIALHTHARGKELPIEADTTLWVDEVEVLCHSLKPGALPLAISPVAASIFSAQESDRLLLESPNDLSLRVPNLLMPDYGSRMTSSIYVRGLGARIDQPAMGLTIDNIPILNKDAYDLDLLDMERVEVLRGPQSTLYGRNTIGGVMNITTRSALDEEWGEVRLEYGSGRSYKFGASSYFKPSTGVKGEWGMGLTAGYYSTQGHFENEYTGQMCDHEQSGGISYKVGYRNYRGWQVENTLALSWVEQGGYPYRSLDAGDIAYNDPCSYERTSLMEGLRLQHEGEKLLVQSMTSYQFLDDRMTLDQDFRPESYFTLAQDRREHALTEELTLRPAQKPRRHYNWIAGAFGFYKNSAMVAPVNFKEQGLQELIIDNVEEHTGLSPIFPDREFLLNSDFKIQTYGVALYHESYLDFGRWHFTLGLRLDQEWATMEYLSYTTQGCTMGSKQIEPLRLQGREELSSTELLPKATALYRLGHHRLSTLYLAVSRGFKAGGFNTQMFSDVLQAALMREMGAAFDRHYDIEKVVEYQPEYSWNYELGGHLHLLEGDIKMDWDLFFIDCRNQQLTCFPPGRTTGRMMTNAGHTHSYGGELSATITPTRHLQFDLAYGYTHATFRQYQSGTQDYRGKRVPYAPAHTLSVGALYRIPIGWRWLENLIPMVDLRGAGDIYWNEENSRHQPLYTLLGATLRLEHPRYTLDLWGRNLLDTHYDLFYFKSVGREFVQQGLPRTWGATLKIKL